MFSRALILALTCVCAWALNPIPLAGDDSDCALYLTGPGRTSAYDYSINLLKGNFGYEGQHTCITYEAINQAYLEARNRILVSQPKGDWKPEDYGSVGELVLDISISLARRYGLTYEEIEKGLPLIDTSRTLIREVCPPIFSHVECRAGKYRRLDGLCNNLEHPTWGATNSPFQRLIGPLFSDGINAPRISHTGHDLPLSRVVSRTMHPDEGFHDHAGTVMVIAWGQFMDHDYTLTGTPLDPINRNDPEECCKRPPHLKHPYCNEIHIPEDDYFYRLFGVKCIDFVRAFPSPRPGCRLGSRVAYNTLTGVIDGNTVYGVTEKFARKLRTGYGGLLRMNPVFKEYGLKDLLPLKLDIPDEGCTRPNKNMYCFEAGEIRVNEQLVLTVMHTLMAREHNRVAKALAEVNSHWDDETLYQEARRINIAEIQHITYNEFLPILLGKDVMEKFGLVLEKEGYWEGYDAKVNPDVIASFAAAAYRFGHSLLPTAVERWSKAHKFIASKRLSDLIRRPYDLYRAGVLDEYVMGLMNQVAQAMDDSITQEVTNHLFKKVGARFGMDLVSFNMQRGREFGIPGYMEFRKFCGLPGAESFQDLFGTMTNHTVRKYETIFEHPIDVDLWSGGVSERPLPGSMLGPTFACIIATQFSYSRRGDRFWFELPNQPSSFTREQLAEIRKSRLARVICDNTDIIDTVQLYPMVLPDHELNPRVPCRSGIIPSMDFTKWAEPAPFHAAGKQFITEANFHNTTNIHSDTENNALIVKNEADTNTSEVQTNCDCNYTDANLQKQNCEAVILEASNIISDDSKNKNNAIDNNCLENAKGERNQVPAKPNDVSSDTILKYVYQKNAKANEGEKTKGHFKNSLRKKRSPVQNDPRPFAKSKAPLIVNYETSHAPSEIEILEPQQQFFGNNVKNSALADFNIETIHENPQNNKNTEVNNDHLELQLNYQNPDSIKKSLNKDYGSNNNERISNKDRESSSSQESVENSRSEENEDSTEKKESQEYNESKENNLDSGKKDNEKLRKQHDYRSSESTENTKENDESKEFALYKDRDDIDGSEENKDRHKATHLNENEESRENEDYNKEFPLKQETKQTDSSSSESNEDDPKLLNKHNNTHLSSKDELINKNDHAPIQDVDLDNFSYERIKVNKNGKVEAIKETPDVNSDESNTSAPNNPKTKSENYNEFNSLSEEKSSDSSSSIENNEPTHINDGEIKPVVEINSDVDSIEIIGENSKEKAELNNENESLETLLGVKDKEDIDNNDKLAEQKKAPENGDVKQEFERIPLDYKHDNKMQDENAQNITPDIKEDKNNAQTENNNDEKNQGTLDAITPKDEKYDEHLNFKFDDIAIKLPEIKLPDDILDYAYEEPVYDSKKTHEPIKERFYHYKDEDSYEEQPKKDTDDDEDEDEESDHDYYSRRYGNSDDKQEYKAKKKIEDDEDEDLYEKFVRERFGKKGSFQKRSEKLQIQKDQPNARLYKTIQNVLQKTKAVEKEAEKSGDPNARYAWTLEYGQNA